MGCNKINLRDSRKALENEILATIDHYDSTMEEFQKRRKGINEDDERTCMKLLRKQVIKEGKIMIMITLWRSKQSISRTRKRKVQFTFPTAKAHDYDFLL